MKICPSRPFLAPIALIPTGWFVEQGHFNQASFKGRLQIAGSEMAPVSKSQNCLQLGVAHLPAQDCHQLLDLVGILVGNLYGVLYGVLHGNLTGALPGRLLTNLFMHRQPDKKPGAALIE